MYCIIVKRGDFQMYDLLYKSFGSRVPVIWDRRQRTAPSASSQSSSTTESAESKESTERRNSMLPASWQALGFVVVHR